MKAYVREIIERLGGRLVALEPLACGSTCSVWRILTDKRLLVLRYFDKRSPSIAGKVDMHLRRLIASGGGRVADPIIGSWDIDEGRQKNEWIIDAFVQGEHPERGAIASTICADLGNTLASLHDIPTRGYGVPRLTKSRQLEGSASNAIAGLCSRFENPIPDDEPALIEHPACLALPSLVDKLRPRLSEIRELAAGAAGVICHSDLHERQLICQDGRLGALIDFGDATVADPRWDFASIYYFHGSSVLQNVIAAYTGNCLRRGELMHGAVLFSLGIAMHHAARSRHPKKAHRLRVAT